MSRPKHMWVNFGSIALLTSLAICIVSPTKMEPNGNLRRWRLIAKAGRIEKSRPRERESAGIYKMEIRENTICVLNRVIYILINYFYFCNTNYLIFSMQILLSKSGRNLRGYIGP